jgi:hypothetical protein
MSISPFNSALETGVRILTILAESYPNAHDLSRLVQYDYLTVHSADANGPPSLHPPLPMRSGELLVRRGLIDAGLRLMMSRSLVRREPRTEGLLYTATEEAGAFLNNLKSMYILDLRNRAEWVAATFDKLSTDGLNVIVNQLFRAWTTEFQPTEFGAQAELF